VPSKPTDLPRWATAETNNTDPSSGQKDPGWLVGQKPISSSIFNWWMNLVYQWLAWLDGLWDGDGNLTLDADASVSVSGDGKYKRGERKRPLSVTSGRWISDNVAANERYFANGVPHFTSVAGGGGWAEYAIPLVVEEGERIKAVSSVVQNSVTDVLKLELWRIGLDGVQTQIGATQTSTDHTMAFQTLAVAGLTEAVDGDHAYHIYIYCNAFANNPDVVAAQQITDVP